MNTSGGHAARNRTVATLLVVAALTSACGSSSGTKASDKTTTTAATTVASTAAKGSTTTSQGSGSTAAPGSSAPSGSSDFCTKISDAEAKAVLGVKISRTEPGTASGSQSCIKGTLRQTDLSKAAYVSFSSFPAVGPMASFDKLKSSLPGSKVLSGLGDQALYSATTGAVFGFLNGKVFQVQVVKGGRPGNEADAVTMAKTLVGRLG